MLETKYGMKYSFPHSVCHIIDNSMYAGELPVTVTDDPSLYATLVVTGAPMGEDNQIVSINRSDVLNVAYGMSNLTASDIEKYGQSVTYPSSLIAQGVPVKFLRVMPSDATYAFSCLLIQWRWDGSTMHVRYKTSADLGNNGLPPGVVHSRFKNTKAFNESLVKGFHENEATDEYGVVWKQRVFMNFIAAGRGSEYNHYNYAINEMNQARRPANAKYYFSTIDTNTDMTVESFTASLINQNNASRIDAIDSVNVVVGKRIKGSSLLVPYVNESAIKELYAEYTARMQEMYDAKIDPINGNIEWVNEVIKTLNINTFDCLYGLYLYNGDTDVNLPYYQVDMINLNIPKLDESNRLTAYLDDQADISALIANPTILNDRLNSISYGINDDYQTADKNSRQMYHVGDVFLSTGNSVNINMITSINQYTGSVTSIPINQVYTDYETDNKAVKDIFRATIDIDTTVDDSAGDQAVKDAVKDLISRKKLIPRGTVVGDAIQYQNDFVLIVQHGKTSINNLLPTFAIGEVKYNNRSTSAKNLDPTVSSVKYFTDAGDVYKMLVYPSSKITSFATDPGDEFFETAGATVIVTSDAMVHEYDDELKVPVGTVYVNPYTGATRDGSNKIKTADLLFVESPAPFVNGTCPASVAGTKDVLNEAYDLIIYQQSATTGISWTVTNGSPVNDDPETHISGYKVGQVLKLMGERENPETHETEVVVLDDVTSFRITDVIGTTDQSVSIATNVILAYNEVITPGDYATSVYEYKKITEDPYTDATPAGSDTWAANTYVYKDANDKYVLDSRATAPSDDWKTTHKKASAFDGSQYFIKDSNDYVSGVTGDVWNADKWYELTAVNSNQASALKIRISANNIQIKVVGDTPTMIQRYVIAGTQGSLYRYTEDPTIIPANYYSPSYGINPNSELGGVSVKTGYSGFFDDNLSDIEFKWKYSELLVKAYRGDKSIDPRIMSPMRCPAKFCFDGATNTIVGQTILPYMKYKPIDIINASTIFTDDEKEQVLLNSEVIRNIKDFADIDVKQAMYDLMVYRCYYGMPEDKRPLGPGYGFQVLFDSGVTDANTMLMINQSFNKRFNNPNASWDIGGFTSTVDGITYTYPKRVVDNLFGYIKPNNNINLPFTGPATLIPPTEYSSFFPDIDATDWELRELLYNSGGNAWVMDINGNLRRESQRTLYRENGTSDLIQESNMRTLSQLCYLLQNKINDYLMAYNEDGVLKTLKDECDNMFSNWVGKSIQALDITFKRDINPADGGEVVVCYCNVTFRGLILRVPIIVNVQRRTTSES